LFEKDSPRRIQSFRPFNTASRVLPDNIRPQKATTERQNRRSFRAHELSRLDESDLSGTINEE